MNMNTVQQHVNGITIPEGYDSKVIKDWIGDDRVSHSSHNKEAGNFTVMVNDKKNRVRYLRFFILATKTVCSVDYDSGIGSRTLWELLQDKFAS
jgi:hypothetical protein